MSVPIRICNLNVYECHFMVIFQYYSGVIYKTVLY